MALFSGHEIVKIDAIKSHLKDTINNFISNNDVPNDVDFSNLIVSGGCFASLWHGEDVNDFDIYFKNNDTPKEVIAFYVKNHRLVKRYHDLTEDVDGNKQKLLGYNAISLEYGKIQLITCTSGKPIDIVNTFDYLHSRWWYDYLEDKLYINGEVLNAIKDKRLVLKRPDKYDLKRENKFLKRGWNNGNRIAA